MDGVRPAMRCDAMRLLGCDDARGFAGGAGGRPLLLCGPWRCTMARFGSRADKLARRPEKPCRNARSSDEGGWGAERERLDARCGGRRVFQRCAQGLTTPPLPLVSGKTGRSSSSSAAAR